METFLVLFQVQITNWFKVQYDGEDLILSFNVFLDIEKGYLNIVGEAQFDVFPLPEIASISADMTRTSGLRNIRRT